AAMLFHSFCRGYSFLNHDVEKTVRPSVESVFLLISISNSYRFIRHILSPLFTFFSFFTFRAAMRQGKQC
ncbi:hypothetical protein, partial [Citrobacter sp. S55_ASV_140]|uniref:hypothetical protein n=1 Tax=Citrobacter sp. S55_ASV_140 TaxID=2846984 RepID=UPI001C12781A